MLNAILCLRVYIKNLKNLLVCSARLLMKSRNKNNIRLLLNRPRKRPYKSKGLSKSTLCLSLVSIWTFFAFRCSFWFFVPTKSHNEQCDAQMETSTKNQNEQQKAITSNKRHLPVLVFEIELILSQKQERATKSSKRQRTANGNTYQKPKRATKSNKEHFSFPFSFIRTSSGPVEGGLYQEQ